MRLVAFLAMTLAAGMLQAADCTRSPDGTCCQAGQVMPEPPTPSGAGGLSIIVNPYPYYVNPYYPYYPYRAPYYGPYFWFYCAPHHHGGPHHGPRQR